MEIALIGREIELLWDIRLGYTVKETTWMCSSGISWWTVVHMHRLKAQSFYSDVLSGVKLFISF